MLCPRDGAIVLNWTKLFGLRKSVFLSLDGSGKDQTLYIYYTATIERRRHTLGFLGY